MRAKKGKFRVALLVISVILTISVFIYLDNSLLQISQYTVTSDKIPSSFNGFKILQLSDLHSASFGKDNKNLIERINKENPDIIVITGDMINTKDDNFDVFLKLAKELGKNYPTYYIVGNHEQALKDDRLNLCLSQLTASGIKVLDNEKMKIVKDNQSINLYGMWFNLKYYRDVSNQYTRDMYFDEKTMEKVLGAKDDTEYNILLTHNPLYFDTYSKWGADLTISGHIHGGMIRIPFIGGLLSPERDFFPKYSAGMYEFNAKKLIVNRGLGNGNFGIRIFNRPEISVINLSTQ